MFYQRVLASQSGHGSCDSQQTTRPSSALL